MAGPWTIAPATERVELDAQGRAEVTFTVTNSGPVDQRLVLDVVPGENANRAWFTVSDPQRLVPFNGSVSYLASIAVPPGTPAGAYWVAGRVYSADSAPEETSVVSDRVTFEVKPTEAPVPWWRKWWWLIAAAALLIVALVVVLVVVLGGDDEPPDGGAAGGEAAVPTEVRTTKQIALAENNLLDLDNIVFGAAARAQDIQFDPQSDGLINPLNGARLAKIGPTDRLAEDCTAAPVPGDPVRVSDWNVGEVLCVRTGSGRLSALVLERKFRVAALTLQLSVTTFERPDGNQ
jgi:hypothetical protein